MRHVFGIAFSRVEMDDSARQELELSFLRIVYAVSRVRQNGDEGQGYLAVVRQEARDAIRRLKTAYGVGDEVRVVFASLLVSDLTRLADAAEKVRSGEDVNAEREIAGTISAGALYREVSVNESGVVFAGETGPMPFGVLWDFYGVREWTPPGGNDAEALCPRLL
ncbi:MAG: hypothetical protein ACOC9B_06815 [Chloroflexota bacterium]